MAVKVQCDNAPSESDRNRSNRKLGSKKLAGKVNGSPVQRRVGPRFQPVDDIGKEDSSVQSRVSLGPHRADNVKKGEPTVQRRVSPRFQRLAEIGKEVDSSVQCRVSRGLHRIDNVEKKESPVQRRVGPRLHCVEDIKKEDTSIQRRVSPRLQNIPEDKRPYYGNDRRRSLPDHPSADGNSVSKKKAKIIPSEQQLPVTTDEDREILNLGTEGVPKFDDQDKSALLRVKETLRIYNMYYLQFVQRSLRRPDLKALSKMKETHEILYPKKRFGNLPGIQVGHQFFSRAEMAALGFHGPCLKGIDFMGESYSKLEEYNSYSFPLAVSIVLSGQYDDVDNYEEVVYTGQGGNDLLGKKLQIKDQVMNCGNFALKNNMKQGVPVRVTCGHICAEGNGCKIYTYDGLYKVVDCWQEKGVAGYTVYKYRLKRLGRQPKLVCFARSHASKVASDLPCLVCKDISNGQEDICIPVFNEYDNPPVTPAGFSYIKSIKVSNDMDIPSSAPGCRCQGNCTNSKTCPCARLNGSEFPYVDLDGGRLVEARDVVFECGPRCACGPNCGNRISQQGLKYRLEVYRTSNKGWAVRSLDFIPSGAPVCEYVGILKKNNELDDVSENDYIFDIDCWHTMNEIEGRERRYRDVLIPPCNSARKHDGMVMGSEPEPEFCIDAGSYGNVARFVNHSCEPNLFVQCVLSSYHDVRLARVVLFASDNIVPYQELTYDYGYKLDSVIGPNGKIKQMPCHCGEANCRKRLY